MTLIPHPFPVPAQGRDAVAVTEAVQILSPQSPPLLLILKLFRFCSRKLLTPDTDPTDVSVPEIFEVTIACV